MELDETIKKRRSIRKYKPDSVSDDLVNQIIEAGQWAPSAYNHQPIEFIVVKDAARRCELAKLFPHGPFLVQAPVAIVVVCDKENTNWALYDGAAAVQNMLLKIQELGLGSCWLGGRDEPGVRKLLNIPETYELITCLPIGYPDETKEKTRNTPKTHRETFNQN